MTSQQRLDQLERIGKLTPAAGIRVRRNMRYVEEKIGIMIDAQIANEAQFTALAESQKHTDNNLDALIYILRLRRNGKQYLCQRPHHTLNLKFTISPSCMM